MSDGGNRWRRAGFAGAAIGLVAAGVAAERLTVHRSVRQKARLALDAAGPYGSLRGTPGSAIAEDGTELYFETEGVADGEDHGQVAAISDESGPDGAAEPRQGGARSATGPPDTAVDPGDDAGRGPSGTGNGPARREPTAPAGELGGALADGTAGEGAKRSGAGFDRLPGAREAAAAAATDGAGGPSVPPIRLDTDHGAAPYAPQQRTDNGSRPGDDDPAEPSQRGRLLRLLHRRRRHSAGWSPEGDAADGATAESAEADPAGTGAPAPTVVFCHGYCLAQDAWHFQRAALRGALRAVYWDQRSHGRSARGPVGEPVSIELLGRDLKAVLDEAVPTGPVVLVGHSMGGMTVMALAAQYPQFVAERVAGVAFIGSSAGGLGELTYGLPLPPVGARALRRVVPGVLNALVSQTELVERGRRATADLFAGLVKRYSFGSARDVDPGVARFAERLIESVPVDVVAEFYPAFAEHEKTDALAEFDGIPALVLAGDRDLMTPLVHSEAIAAALPGARLAVLEHTGHLSMLERPEAVNEHIAELLTRTIRTHEKGRSTADSAPSDGRRASRGPG